MQRLDDLDRRVKLIENSSSNKQTEEPLIDVTANDDLQF